MEGNNIKVSSDLPGRVVVWKGDPSYDGISAEFYLDGDTLIGRGEIFGDYEGKLVFKLFDGDELADINIIHLTGGIPWLISKNERTEPADRIPRNMVLVPGATLRVTLTANDDFVAIPVRDDSESVQVDSFLVDVYPVTNEEYYRFVAETGYYPQDTVNYLRHWVNGIYRQGQERYPVVYVSLEDARAYASWAGKRLPAEMEWQLAAQGTDGRLWPWGNEFHGTKCNNAFERPTPVDAFTKGQSPYGVFDMVGNVWQLTNDVYYNGTHYFAIIRGGSHYKPTSSWWYVQGGPQPLNKTQMMLLVSPGFDRNSTVGFRCVKDAGKGLLPD
jgi:formylglycine-generating enzyme required for sulfatase activity